MVDLPVGTNEKESQSTGADDSVHVDYVIVFSLSPGNQTDKAAHASALKLEYGTLMTRLRLAGLSATSRPGAKGSQELLILVSAQDESRIIREVEGERTSDWLHGISSAKPPSQSDPGSFSQSYTPSERLRHLYSIITQDASPSSLESPISSQPHRMLAGPGAGITPGIAPFERVKAIFPPHDVKFNNTWISRWSDRSHFSIQIPQIELDEIKDVYGEAIAYYFAFLNFYFQTLILPTGMGFLTWVSGVRFSYLYSVCLILWSVVFVETWTMKERLLAIRWNSLSCHKVEKRRIQFEPERFVKDVVTNELVGYFPWWKRDVRKLVTVPILILFALGLSALISAITAVELIVGEVYQGPFTQILSLLPTVLFAAFVPQLVNLWKSVAMRLVTWENHTYESSYDRSLTIKMFIVQALVAYASLVLTAFVYVPFGSLIVPRLAELTHRFIKHDSVPLQAQTAQYFDTKTLDWSTYSINNERLYQQLFAYIVTNQIVNTFTEIGLPYLMKIATFKYHKIVEERQKKGSEDAFASAPDREDEKDLLERLREEAALPEYEFFDEYAEMAIQFGYVVIWSLVWPIAPLFAFVNNFFELRSDAIKLTKQSRRPVPTRIDSIGPWLDVLSSLTWFGAILNAALVYLFKPSHSTYASVTATGTNLNQTSVDGHQIGLNRTILTNLLEVTIAKSKAKNGDSTISSHDELYHSLLSILMASLIPVLFSEHAYLFARFMIKQTIHRVMWLDSDTFVAQKKAEWELKQSFIGRLDTQSWSIIHPSSSRGSKGTGSEPSFDDVFWSRPDMGMEEIGRLGKTE